MTDIEFLNDNKKNIVFIFLQKKQGEQILFNVRGTGVLLKDKKIITCAHLFPIAEINNIFCGVMEISSVSSKVNKYKTFPIKPKLTGSDDENDLRVFDIIDNENFLEERGFNELDLSEQSLIDNIKSGEGVYFSGFSLANELIGLGMGITLTTDRCAVSSVKYRGIDESIHFLLIDKQVNPGGSGSPVIYKSKIIGLASGTLNRMHDISGTRVQIPLGLGIIRPSNYILKLLSNK